jgi:hypothetical protein
MALSMTFQHRDLSVTNAYCRVSVASVSKTAISFLLARSATAESDPLVVTEYSAPYELMGENPIRQAYLHLKTLPEFANAVDC